SSMKRPQAIEVFLRQIPAPYEEEVRARGLRCDGGEIVRREEQLVSEQRRRHTELHADTEKDAKERQQVRRLADEQVVEEHICEQQRDCGDDSGQPTETHNEPLAEELHEAKLVELVTQREQRREPDEGREDVSLLRDVPEREYAGREHDAEAEEGHRGRVDAKSAREPPEHDHSDEG